MSTSWCNNAGGDAAVPGAGEPAEQESSEVFSDVELNIQEVGAYSNEVSDGVSDEVEDNVEVVSDVERLDYPQNIQQWSGNDSSMRSNA